MHTATHRCVTPRPGSARWPPTTSQYPFACLTCPCLSLDPLRCTWAGLHKTHAHPVMGCAPTTQRAACLHTPKYSAQSLGSLPSPAACRDKSLHRAPLVSGEPWPRKSLPVFPILPVLSLNPFGLCAGSDTSALRLGRSPHRLHCELPPEAPPAVTGCRAFFTPSPPQQAPPRSSKSDSKIKAYLNSPQNAVSFSVPGLAPCCGMDCAALR